ncbi:hypothetical protein CIL05_06535 [Virgibacillus profundi]|uniref:Uncharacterized protein n=1 Tax=Virgibacillus profundi TaxID=2024555 RepID=A0A2A2IEQ6_9BACI|nr:hypothetical protein [Virgibacillus profundi]PAV30117.1 hypothetical protein CIL05_06535 [Virgibacillus profundi]PXY54289.1 hypothetical protein CIT14_06620 [Virgibacillus profundi]
MKKPIQIVIAVFFLLFVTLSGCSMKSEEETITDTKDIAENTFMDDTPIESNYEFKGNSFYLPSGLEEKSGDENNLVLEDGDQTYIVFNNNNEEPLSQLHYNAAQDKNALLLESFSDENKFGYIRLQPDEGEGYELQIGIGGVKITTYTTKGKMEEDTEELMKVAKSIAMDATKESE